MPSWQRATIRWRKILEYFAPATQIGMTATPRRADNADTYRYFGDPIYTYSLAMGIDDGSPPPTGSFGGCSFTRCDRLAAGERPARPPRPAHS